MLLSEKIVKLRKQAGWSQEELAAQVNVSRQSVSKWEATSSIPDLSKVLKLAELFEVSTDYLLKEDVETPQPVNDSGGPSAIQLSLEQALQYVDRKIAMSRLISKGVFLCVTSVIPLLSLLAMANTNMLNITSTVAPAIGIVFLLVMVSIGVSFFIRINQFESDETPMELDGSDLAYGVHGAIKEKLDNYRGTYNLRLSIAISMFIFSFVPLMFGSMLSGSTEVVLMMLNVLLLVIATGIYILLPVSARYEAYSDIMKLESFKTPKSRRTKRAEKLAAFYWPLLTALYIGWSLWTMDWGRTWIAWPVGAILFAALVGLMELLDKEEY